MRRSFLLCPGIWLKPNHSRHFACLLRRHVGHLWPPRYLPVAETSNKNYTKKHGLYCVTHLTCHPLYPLSHPIGLCYRPSIPNSWSYCLPHVKNVKLCGLKRCGSWAFWFFYERALMPVSVLLFRHTFFCSGTMSWTHLCPQKKVCGLRTRSEHYRWK